MNRRTETWNELLIKTDNIYEQMMSEPVQFVAVSYNLRNQQWQLFFFVTVPNSEIEGSHRGTDEQFKSSGMWRRDDWWKTYRHSEESLRLASFGFSSTGRGAAGILKFETDKMDTAASSETSVTVQQSQHSNTVQALNLLLAIPLFPECKLHLVSWRSVSS
jgi:hypothetical protein